MSDLPDFPTEPDRSGRDSVPEDLRRQMAAKARQLREEAQRSARTLKENLGQVDPAQATRMLRNFVQHEADRAFSDVDQGVGRLGVVFVNVYVLNAGGGRWFLVDTGLPGFAAIIRAACEARFEGRPPEGIILTHAHFDHAGNVEPLATAWNVPVWAHRLEMPYLTGQGSYPPTDPTPGGAICFLSRFFPTGGYDLRDSVDLRELPESIAVESASAAPGAADNNPVPGLAGWRWIHTPGHTPGHISLFRAFDKLLLAGDALATLDMDSWTSMVSRKRELARPPTPMTPDWRSAHVSVDKLAALEPRLVAAGHGLPMTGRYVAGEMAELAERMQPPSGGRYTGIPAHFDSSGRVHDLPPAPPDPLKPRLSLAAAALAVAGIGIALFAASRKRL